MMRRIPPVFGAATFGRTLREVVLQWAEAQDGAAAGGDRGEEIRGGWDAA